MKRYFFIISYFLLPLITSAQTTIIPFKSVWKYLDNGSDQGTVWRSVDFDDAAWKSGGAILGYGEGDETTKVSFGPSSSNKYITTYFRKTINIPDVSQFSAFDLSVYRDDGIVLYVNGSEVYRSSMPAGTITYTTLANEATDDGKVAQKATLPSSAFVSGTNVIAVEVHQRNVTNSDLRLDLELIGKPSTVDTTPPVVQSVNRQAPATEATTATSVTYRVTFSEKVTGVDASDFTGNVLSGSLTFSIASVTAVNTGLLSYDVLVNNISGTGELRLDVNNSGTDIVDDAGSALSDGFTQGQSYSISPAPVEEDVTAPVVTSINRQQPTIETTSATVVVFRVNFSEKVRGVDVNDFVVTKGSGIIAADIASSAVTGTDSTVYDVTVDHIDGDGTLRLDLKSASTGIKDSAGNNISDGFTAGQSYTIQQTTTTNGFVSITDLSNITITKNTADKPQSKVWTYNGKWWTVLSTSNGTKIFRLDGSSWTDILTLSSATNAKADCRALGGVTHILLFRGTSTSYLISVEYDAATNKYKKWSKRTSATNITFESGTETATLAVDGNGKLWIASDGANDIRVRWSNSPYSSISAPITIATGVTSDDICAITPMNNKIGVLWSNQNTKRFGFKYHIDGDANDEWSENELPGASSALNIGSGLADDHLSVINASDGTLYCAIKTSYNKTGYTRLGLLVRRPTGSWDKIYTVTTGIETRPIVVLNEAIRKLKVIYSSEDGGGNILYKETSISSISFGSAKTLINDGHALNNATSTHQPYSSNVVVVCSYDSPTPIKAISVLASDVSSAAITSAPITQSVDMTQENSVSNKTGLIAYPNPFTSNVTINYTIEADGNYKLSLYNINGNEIKVLRQAWAKAGEQISITVSEPGLKAGVYMVVLKYANGTKVLKLVKTD